LIDPNVRSILETARAYPAISRIGIFGSYARGENEAGSDLDILFDYEEIDEDWDNEVMEYLGNINECLLKTVQAPKVDLVYYKGVMKSDDERFRKNVLQDVVWIYDKKG